MQEQGSKTGKTGEVNIKLLAFFLTQFHPTQENDAWWGKGFTEWTNVSKAQPLFSGHYQPHLPTDFGFYDLRLPESRKDQIAIAREYGIDGFCYHYYWFSGKRILNRPFDEMLADPEHDMPFCVCWANENWTRRWDAADHEILIAQKYLPDDDINFIRDLVPVFNDPRYIRKEGRPVFLVYRPQHLPDAKKTLSIWRQYCREEAGIGEIFIVSALTHGNEDYVQYGFDAGVEFPPHNLKTGNVNQQITFHEAFSGNVMPYHEVAQSFIDRRYEHENVFRTVFPSWDNTARTGKRAVVHLNGTPQNYEYWLAESIRRTARDFPDEERFVFINAWNEWAEGCHLEPDRRFGRGFLEATQRAKAGLSVLDDFPDRELPLTASVAKRSFSGDLSWVIRCHAHAMFGTLKLKINRTPWLRNLLLPVVVFLRKLGARHTD